jgi:hypothetical protein
MICRPIRLKDLIVGPIMNIVDLLREIAVNGIVAVITFILGLIASKIPMSFTKYRLREFFGNDILTDRFKIVYGMFARIYDRYHPTGKLAPTHQKIYSDNTTFKLLGPSFILSQDTVRGQSYFLQEFAKYRKHPFGVCTDEEALNFHNNSFLCIGGPIANEITDIALKEPSNNFYRFETLRSSQYHQMKYLKNQMKKATIMESL